MGAVARQIPQARIDDDYVGFGIEAERRHDGVKPIFVPNARDEEKANAVVVRLVKPMLPETEDDTHSGLK